MELYIMNALYGCTQKIAYGVVFRKGNTLGARIERVFDKKIQKSVCQMQSKIIEDPIW